MPPRTTTSSPEAATAMASLREQSKSQMPSLVSPVLVTVWVFPKAAALPGVQLTPRTTARGDRLEALYVLALTTDMRQGELLAPHWTDVDLDQGNLQVRATLQRGSVLGEVKTAKGRRRITLTDVGVQALQRRRIRQVGERLTVKTAWAANDLVFCNEVGNYLNPSNLKDRCFAPLLRRAELPAIRFHDLRHSTATLLLSLGAHPKVVQELLGHSQISVTMDTYSHVLPTLQQEAMADFNKVLTT